MKRTTLILLLLALGLGGFVYFYEIRGATQRQEVKENQKQIFSFNADDVQVLNIKTKDITLNLERSDKPKPPKWLIKSPISEPANDAIVSYLMDLLVKGKSEKIIATPVDKINNFGLDEPKATIDIKLKNQQNHQLILGNPNFNKRFLYAQIDPNNASKENIQVLLVSLDFANAVNRELSEWKEAGKQETENSQAKPLPGLPETLPTSTPKQ